MRLSEREIGLELVLRENRVAVLIIENVSQRLSLVKQLYGQLMGQDGNWILSEGECSFDLNRKCELILEPFSIELNHKKMKTKLYQELKEIAEENCYELELKLHSDICNYLESVIEKLPYPMTYDRNWDSVNLMKMYDVALLEECENQYEKLIDYIKLMNQICGTEIFLLLDMKRFFTKEQLLELYKTAFYYKIQLVLIEFQEDKSKNPEEDVYLLDKDLCVIHY